MKRYILKHYLVGVGQGSTATHNNQWRRTTCQLKRHVGSISYNYYYYFNAEHMTLWPWHERIALHEQYYYCCLLKKKKSRCVKITTTALFAVDQRWYIRSG